MHFLFFLTFLLFSLWYFILYLLYFFLFLFLFSIAAYALFFIGFCVFGFVSVWFSDFFVSVEPSLLSFGVSSHCLSNSMSSVLFMYFISFLKWRNSTCLVELSLFFLCSCSLLLLSGFSVSLKFSWFPDWFVQFCSPFFVCVNLCYS